MNKHLSVLVDYGLFNFGRERVVFEILKRVFSNARFDEDGGKSVITLVKGRNKLVISVKDNIVACFGGSEAFNQELSLVEKDCLNDYANSVRSKKQLLSALSSGAFFRFVLVPVLLEAYNYFNIRMNKFLKILNNKSGSRVFLFFRQEKNLKAVYEDKILNVLFNNASFSVRFKREKPESSVINKNVSIGAYQSLEGDAFFAGLPFTIQAVGGKDFEYSFNGEGNSLEELCRIILESLYEYLMIELV